MTLFQAPCCRHLLSRMFIACQKTYSVLSPRTLQRPIRVMFISYLDKDVSEPM